MKYKLFGRSGLKVSELCLGTMTFGTEMGWGAARDESEKIFNLFVEKGGNFFDTANFYTRGTSETFLGDFIGRRRDEFVIGTKYTHNTGNPGNPNAGGNHRKSMMRSLDASLKRLKTDYIDLYWVHAWDGVTPIEEVMRSLDDMIRLGKILYVGISDMPAWLISKANTMADLKGWTSFVGMQLHYSLIERTIEREYFSLAKEFNMSIAAWSPLGGGMLSGKYSKEKIPSPYAGTRYHVEKEWGERLLTPRNFAIVDAAVQIAKETGRTATQVALNWLRHQNALIIPIIGARTVQQLSDDLGCLEFSLTDDQIQRLDDVSRIDLGFPYDFLNRRDIKKMIHGDHFSFDE